MALVLSDSLILLYLAAFGEQLQLLAVILLLYCWQRGPLQQQSALFHWSVKLHISPAQACQS